MNLLEQLVGEEWTPSSVPRSHCNQCMPAQRKERTIYGIYDTEKVHFHLLPANVLNGWGYAQKENLAAIM